MVWHMASRGLAKGDAGQHGDRPGRVKVAGWKTPTRLLGGSVLESWNLSDWASYFIFGSRICLVSSNNLFCYLL